MFGGGEADATIEQHGAAISKPILNVTVFVSHAGGREKNFGDEQLRAIVSAMKDLDKFNALNVSRSSVTDAGIRHLKTLTELERLDVYETLVTVDGLVELQHLPKPSFIKVSHGQYSDEALAKLKGTSPKATILEWDARRLGPRGRPHNEREITAARSRGSNLGLSSTRRWSGPRRRYTLLVAERRACAAAAAQRPHVSEGGISGYI